MMVARLSLRSAIPLRLASWLHDPADDNIAILLGAAGSGRSTLLRAFAEREDLSTVWISARGRTDDRPYESIIRILKTAPSDVVIDNNQLAELLNNFRHLDVTEILPMVLEIIKDTQQSTNRRLIVLSGAETIDVASRELIWLLAPHLHPQGLSTVATGLVDRAPLFSEGDPIIVPPLTPDECYEEIVRHTDVLSPSTVTHRLQRATGGNMRALRSIVSRLSPQQLDGTELLPHPLEMDRSDAKYLISRGANGSGSDEVKSAILRVLAVFALHSEIQGRHPLPGVSDQLLKQLHEEGWLQPTTTHTALAEPAHALAAWNLLGADERVQLHRTFSDEHLSLHPDYLAFHRLYASRTFSADEADAVACALFDSGSHALAQSVTRVLETVRGVSPALAHRLIDHGLVATALRAATTSVKSADEAGDSGWSDVWAELAFLGLAPALSVGPLIDAAEASDAVVSTARSLLFAGNPDVARRVSRLYQDHHRPTGPDISSPESLLDAELALYDRASDAPGRLLGVLSQRTHEGHARETFTDALHLLALGRLADAGALLTETETRAPTAPSQFLALRGLARSTLAIARGRHRTASDPLKAFTLTMPMIGVGSSTAMADLLRLRATLGRTHRFSRQLARVRRLNQRTGAAFSRSEILAATGFSELLLHRPDSAIRHLRQALDSGGVLVHGRLDVVADLLESLVAAGRAPEEVADTYRHYSDWLPDHLGDRAGALRARCELLSSAPNGIHAAYRSATAAIACHFEYDHARTRLAYGRLIQRYDDPEDAVEIIREASTAFQSLELDGFVESARRIASSSSSGQASQLSPVEAEVLALVKQGHTNQQIATRLFASKRTIETHLTQIFRALSVSTKRELLEVR